MTFGYCSMFINIKNNQTPLLFLTGFTNANRKTLKKADIFHLSASLIAAALTAVETEQL